MTFTGFLLDSVVLFSILNRENPIEIDRIGLSNIFHLVNWSTVYCWQIITQRLFRNRI
jgi:hypothetical protein